ncbi:unnamed protein product [Eruca vesicaria subsp. sativa]|uniref:TIR domain-containing protein n=1 Tax=Eruca vesicaria subsp. sativa TaxID=29727 RepID=A0ABC8JR61_ERUVS|nr:unnamed protein product [Eruca vesicaria subsp. sativa]
MASSSSTLWKYDVFLSFRGEDTRKNIVGHLHKELVNRGIVTFKDDKRLEMGDSISQELSRAIQESRIALVVLSKNYATSRWCLNELLMIMDLHLRKKMKVVPIFYGVDPSHVRHQTGSFTLDKYQASETANKVTNWRVALTQIASIAGKDSAACEDEASMIEEIGEDISNQLLIMQPVDFSNIIGMNIHMEGLNPLLSMESESDVRMIGIWGMGGIGKTTIAKCLFDRLSRTFPARCFLENVSKIYRERGVSYLMERFLSTTLGLYENKKKKQKLSTGAELGPHEVKARLRHRKVFLVLDNVDDMKQMHALAQDTSWFGPGSRVIITTRDKGLLNSYGVTTVYDVKCLDTDDSRKIFNQLAFEGGLPPCDYYDKLSIRASRIAEGLPSALEAYGLFFRRMLSLKEWEDALCRFERTPHTNVADVLKISYDSLEEADKRVLLHVACLFTGEPLQRAINFLNDDELQGRLALRILADKSLIEITEGGCIKMHYLVQQTAREIECQESMWRSRGKRVLWDPTEIYEMLRLNRYDESVGCMSLHMCKMPDELYLDGHENKNYNNLKFLKVYRHMDHIEPMLHFKNDNTELLSSRLLRLLHWDAFPLTAFPDGLDASSLFEVILRHSNLTSLWKSMKLLQLRRLDLTGSRYLEQLPDLSMAVNLEELITQGCKRLKRIPESICYRKRLRKLDVSFCDELNSYHITIRELNGRHHQQIVLYFSRFNRRSYSIAKLSIANLSIGGTIQIEMLSLEGNVDHLCFSTDKQATSDWTKRDELGLNSFKSFIRRWSEDMAMSEFHVHGPVKKAEQIFRPTFHGFSSLDIIRFNYKSDGASFLCYSLSMFPCLKELNLINLNIKVIPDDICTLQSLEKLDWSGNDFETLPETMKQLQRLKYVSLCNCFRLKALPELVQVETIKLSGCMNLLLEMSHTEQDCRRFQWLELWLDGCKNIQSISNHLRYFVSLSYLDLSSHEFETLPSSIKDLSSLGTLCLNKCKKLKSIQGVPLSLKYLYAHGCESLETVSLPLNHSIKHLDLSHCFCLKQNEHLVTQFLKDGHGEEESPRFACFPTTKVPSYFDVTETGKSITVQILPSPKVLGFDACVMLTCGRLFRMQFSPFSYSWSWEVDSIFQLELKQDLFHSHESSFNSVKSDHLFIFRGSKTLGEEIENFSLISDLKISDEFKFPPAEIKSCGVRLVLEAGQTDKINLEKMMTSQLSFS